MARSNLSVTAVYNRKGKLNSQGKALIQLRLHLNSISKYVSTGIYIEPKEWNDKRRTIRNNTILDAHLKSQISAIEQHFTEIKLKGQKPPTLDELTHFHKYGDSANISFTDFMRQEIKKRSKKLAEKTVENHTSSLNKLTQFKSQIQFHDFTFEFLEQLRDFLLFDYKHRGKSLSNNSTHRLFRDIRTYLNLAVSKEIITVNNNPFKKYKLQNIITLKQQPPKYLSRAELEILENLVIPENQPTLKMTLQIFLFACYTGLRVSDLLTLEENHIHISRDSSECILKKKMVKTKQFIELPLHSLFYGKPYSIILRCLGKNNKYLLHNITEQAINRGLKDIQELAGIDTKLTIHVARHTFGTTTLNDGFQITEVKKLMGHQDIKTTLQYAHVSKNKLFNRATEIYDKKKL